MYGKFIKHDYLATVKEAEEVLVELRKEFWNILISPKSYGYSFSPGLYPVPDEEFLADVVAKWGGDDYRDCQQRVDISFYPASQSDLWCCKRNALFSLVSASDTFGMHIENRIISILDNLKERNNGKVKELDDIL